MADTQVKQIVNAVAALLAAAGPGKPAGLTVTTSRIQASTSTQGQASMAVYPFADDPKADNTPRNRLFQAAHRVLTLVIECRMGGTDLDNEALRAWAIQQIMADCSLGGLALDVNEGSTEWADSQDSTTDTSQALIQILVEYKRAKASLEPET